MKTISKKEFEAKYGDPEQYGFGKKKDDSLFSTIKEQIGGAATAGVEKMGRGFEQSQTGTSLIDPIEAGLKVGAGAIETITSPLAPVFAPIGKGVQYVADKISDIPAVQKFAGTKAGEVTSRVAEDIQDLSIIGGTVAGFKGAPSVSRGVSQKVSQTAGDVGGAVGRGAEKVAGGVKTATVDIIPTRGNVINQMVQDAFRFTDGDVVKFKNRTGNNLGEWVAEHKLIGGTKAETLANVNKFFSDNYAMVRSEIGKVTDTYTAKQVPRVKDGLNFLKEDLGETIGLEKSIAEINTLLKKGKYTLEDVQRVKELIDKHENIYKQSGEVSAGKIKQGLAEIRKELQKFIEDEVEAKTGADIRKLNNNVASAKDIVQLNKLRETGAMSGKMGLRDTLIGVGLFAGVNPLVGLAYFFGLKLAESPAARLRFARWLDSLPKSKKTEINNAILRGEAPKEAVEAAGVELRNLETIKQLPHYQGTTKGAFTREMNKRYEEAGVEKLPPTK